MTSKAHTKKQWALFTLEEYMAYTRTLSEEGLIDVMKEAADYAKPILGDSDDMKNEWYEKYEEKWGF